MAQGRSGVKRVVLVVEDEALLRLDAVQLVEDCGLSAEAVSSADEALALLERRNDIGIVFTDVQMPGSMNGVKLAEVISKRWPAIHIIVASGNLAAYESQLPPSVARYEKPYNHAHACETLHRCLGHRPKSRH